MHPNQFEIAIICALPLEAEAVDALFDEFYDTTEQPPETANSYTLGRIGQHHVVLAHMPEMGKVGAAGVASRLSTNFGGIKVALVVGICGGVPFTAEKGEIILGDVIISHNIVEYDSGKQYPDGFRKRSGTRDTLPRPSQDIRAFISKLKIRRLHNQIQQQAHGHLLYFQDPSRKERHYPGTSHDVLFDSSYSHKHHPTDISLQCSCTTVVCEKAITSDCSTLRCAGKLIERKRLSVEQPLPFIHIGTMASADTVMKSGMHRDKMTELDEIIGFEMEGAGVWDNIPCIIIKGVCDYADSHKSKVWQKYAVLTAACCTKAVLESYQPTTRESVTQRSETMSHLRDYYITANRLHIQRISGELLPMDQCYINLAVVESLHSTQARGVKGSSPFSLSARLGIEKDKIDKQLSLPKLFEPRKRLGGAEFVPKRILIRGRAGVGKTTLCKKIVSDHLHHKMWHQLFGLLLWIPLRRLKGRPPERSTIVDLFHDLYFSEHEDGKRLASSLWDMVKDSTTILFVLDGLDEVSQEWDSESPMNKVLLRLLNHSQVIITSRPYGMKLDSLRPLDLELETIGFNTKQVEAYIRNIEKRYPQKVDKMLSFIQQYPLIQDLARIPIQLDAICYSWDSSFMADEPKTMTTLYQAITLKLWQKDILRLGKSDSVTLLNEHSVQDLSPLKIQSLVSEEIKFLESIAFIGLYNNTIEFSASYRHQIRDYLTGTVPDVPDTTLKKISFLHTSDITVRDQDQSYHFLHLTFQEFFAAQYFVRHWVNGQEMICLELGQRRPKVIRIEPRNFLQKEKLNSRYDILWRFVAGLLQEVVADEQKTAGPLECFFLELDAEPRDLLGPAHQRTLMHCLSEVVSDLVDDYGFRLKIEEHLQQWLLFECNFHDKIYLGVERECPDNLLTSLLQGGPFQVKRATLVAVRQRQSMLSQNFLEAAVQLLKDGNSNLNAKAAQALNNRNLSSKILKALDSLINDQKSDIRSEAAWVLGTQNLPRTTLDTFVSLLKDEDSNVIRGAALALGQQSLPEEILEVLLPLLMNSDSEIRSSVAWALSRQHLPRSILEALIPLLKGEDSNIRCTAVQPLVHQQDLPRVVLDALVLLLKDKNFHVGCAVKEVLQRQPLPQSILEALIPLLRDGDIRYNLLGTLIPQTLSQPILETLVTLLRDRDAGDSAAAVLGSNVLPQAILEAFVALLGDNDAGDSASQVLRHQKLPQPILEVLLALLRDKDARYSATKVLQNQNLPQPILQALAPLLKDSDSGVNCYAAAALGRSAISQEILEALLPLVKDGDLDAKRLAIPALARATVPLPQDILETMIQLLKDGDSSEKLSAALVLFGGSTPLSPAILEEIVLVVKDMDAMQMCIAAKIMEKNSIPLQQAALEALVSHLGHSSSDVRFYAARALAQISTLPQSTIEDLVSLLRNESNGVNGEVETILRNQNSFYSMLPDLTAQDWKYLYTVWLRKSFAEQLSCYWKEENILYLDMPKGPREVIFKHNQAWEFKRVIREVQLDLGVPPWSLHNPITK